MFLAHFSGWSHSELMEMDLRDVSYWFVEAKKLYDEMHRTDG